MPQLGYWQKIQYGYKVVKIKLPPITKDQGIINLRYRDEDGNYVKIEKSPKSILKEYLNNQKLPLKVSERLTNPDPLVVQAQNSLQSKKNERFIYNGFVETKSSELKIKVAPSNIPRALRFMDAFIKLLYARGHKIEYKHSRVNGLIYGVHFEFGLREKSTVTIISDPYPNRVYSPSGIFVFSSNPYTTKDWSDGKGLIEEKLLDILIYIELSCKRLSDIWAENDRKRQIELEAEQKRKELLARKQAELNSVADLLNQAIRLQQAKFMRDYVYFVSQNGKNNLNLNADLNDWISWAKHKIDWYDPLIQVEDDLLDDDDRQTLVERLRKK